jgi:hypothetical protein
VITLVTAMIALGAALLASSATALTLGRRPRYIGKHRALL